MILSFNFRNLFIHACDSNSSMQLVFWCKLIGSLHFCETLKSSYVFIPNLSKSKQKDWHNPGYHKRINMVFSNILYSSKMGIIDFLVFPIIF